MALAAYVVLVVRHGWVTEDAYITLRTVDNFVSGHGLTWNVSERVQAYTHPLWMFVLSALYAITREAYLTTLSLSAVCSFLAAWLLGFKVARSATAGFAALVALCFSRYFIDFSTSGLENPMTHLLYGVFAFLLVTRPVSRGSVFWLAAVGALMSVNRLDTTLLYAPPLAYAIVRALRHGVKGKRLVVPLCVAFLPLIAWEVFSLIYYGFPFPNTAYAKLGTGIPAFEAASQGLIYLMDSAMRDPATLTLLLGSAGVVFIARESLPVSMMLGAILYTIYVVKVGGDFMAGRFLTAPLYVALCAVARTRIAEPPAWGSLLLVVPALLFSVVELGRVPAPPARGIAPSGVADERQFYLDSVSLAQVTRNRPDTDSPLLRSGQRLRRDSLARGQRLVSSTVTVGLTGFGAGPQVYLVDDLALTDPLLARLPAKRQVPWRIGHFPRQRPERYIESIRAGRCELTDRDLCVFWKHLRRITEGPIWSWARFLTIAKMNLGMYDHLIDRARYRSPGMKHVEQAAVATRLGWGHPDNDPALVKLGASGVEVALDGVHHEPRVGIAASADDGFDLVFLKGHREVGSRFMDERFGGGLMVRDLRVPSSAVDAGYDRIRIFPTRGDGRAVLGHVLPHGRK
jgi:arabinofuranosyltransferase